MSAAHDRLHNARGGGVTRRVLHDAHAHDVAIAHARVVRMHREDIVPDAGIFGNNDAKRLGDLVAAHDG